MEKITCEVNRETESFVPYYKKIMCAGRAAEGLRDDWRKQLKVVQKEIQFEYIRFHGIFHEDMMVYKEDENGEPIYNWQYVDELMDFLLENNLRPMLELSFTPYAMASGETHQFWWKCNITPPKDYGKWVDLVRNMVIHLINRYGIKEILTWYFEVWNEADRNFWTGTFEDYCRLYEETMKGLKAINKNIKVGGPASPAHSIDGSMYMVDQFITYCEERSLPIDFITIHPYPNMWGFDSPEGEMGYRSEDSLTIDLNWTHNRLNNTIYKDVEIHITEWNSSPSARDLVHDTAFMAPFIIKNALENLGNCDSLGFWAFSDIFEESGAGSTLFHGGFGMINVHGLKKPSYYGYWFLSKLGTDKIKSGDNYFITKKGDDYQILMWNYCHYNKKFSDGDISDLKQLDRYSIYQDKESDIEINITGLNGDYRVIQQKLGRNNGCAYDIWLKNGAFNEPTKEEIEIINKKIGPTCSINYIKDVDSYKFNFNLSSHDVVFIELQKVYKSV